MMAQELPIVVGDANGADRAVLLCLAERGYDDVEVFCVGDRAAGGYGTASSKLI